MIKNQVWAPLGVRDTTISFFESATNFLTGWKLGMWKTDNMAFENVKVVEV